MSFFKDKEWENMDWLNRAVEPYVFSLNDDLAKIPSSVEITFNDVFSSAINGSSLSILDMVKNLSKNANITSPHFISLVRDFGEQELFGFVVEPDTQIDLLEEKLNGSITFVKKVESISEEMILQFLPKIVYRYQVSPSRSQASFVNEVMDILDCKESRSSYSTRKKSYALMDHLNNIYRENKWNIRNVDLSIKMLGWIKNYCESGDRCSLANLSKLKCMIHNGHPIYSMEEVK